MIDFISDLFINYLIRRSIITENNRTIYRFGVNIMIWHILHISIMLIVGLTIKRFCETILFIIFYSILRKYAGGFHAQTEMKCLICSIIGVILANKVAAFFVSANMWVPNIFLALSSGIIWKLAPVDNFNKSLSLKEKAVYSFKSKCMIVGFGILYILVSFLFPQYCMIIVSSIFIEACGLLIGIIHNSCRG